MKRLPTGLLPSIALEDSGPIYQQLADWFRRAIAEGRLRPGQRVPSTRALAGELGVSRLPVLSAYELLHAEGYLESFSGAGTCVAAAIPHEAPPAPTRRLPRVVAASAALAPRPVAARVAAMASPPQTWLKSQGAFRVGVPALDHFPHAVWSRLLSRHARHVGSDALIYGDTSGHAPLREAIVEYLATVRAVHADTAQLMITSGAQHGLQICAHALLDPGDRAWVEEPGYPSAHQALAAVGAVPVLVPVDADGMDVATGVRRAPTARLAYVTPSHQFPLGATMSAARRIELLQWAARAGSWIVEDDYDSEYRYGGRPITALQGLDTDARVIYVGTFSKVLFPALRLGYLVVPKDLLPAFRAARDALDTCSPMLPQRALHDFIREGHFARHIRRMRMLYAARRAALQAAIRQHLPDALHVVGAEAGMQLTALLAPELDDIALSRRATQAGVSIRPLSPCYRGETRCSGVILGYGNVDEDAIEEGVKRLRECL